MTSEETFLPPQRMHPTSVLFRVGNYAKQLAFPLIVFLFLARGDSWELYASIFAIPLAIYECWRYFTTTYQITNDQLVVKSGALFRSERNIPLQRIQNIDLVQNLFHRLLQVAEVRIETASGSDPEAILKVVGVDEVERLRLRIFSGRAATAAIPAAEQPGALPGQQPQPAEPEPVVELLQLPTIELIKWGLITYRGLAIVGVAFGLMWQLELFDDLEDRWRDPGDLLDRLQGFGTALAIGALILSGIVALTLLSVAWAILKLHNYRLVRIGDSLRVTCGLWTRLTATIPRQRIQLVSLRQSPLHRLFRRVTVSVETAGGSGDADKIPINRRWLVPLVDERRLPEILHEIQPEMELLDLQWQPPAPKARRRMVRKGIAWAIVLSVPWVALAWFVPLIALPLLLILFTWHAYAAARVLAYARTPTGIAFRSGVLTRQISATRVNRIQTLRQSQTPFDRRYNMARVAVDTAGAGPAGHQIEIPYLAETDATALREDLVADASRTDFSWA